MHMTDEDSASTHAHDLSSTNPVDHRVIGLSPQYWSHTPLLIGDLIGLPLVNGVDCFVVPGGSDENETCTRNPLRRVNVIPLSRVSLRGIITAVDRRPNGCVLMVLDDGTGSVDVRCWEDSCGSSDNSMLNEHGIAKGFSFNVGDQCEVMGKIKAMTAGTKYSYNKDMFATSTITLGVQFGCIREVHASSVCTIDNAKLNSWNGEILHWLKCIKFSTTTKKQRAGEILSGKGVLPLLGNEIASAILNSNTAVEIETPISFLHRKCCQTPHRFRQAFFYCHCSSTFTTLDPSFRYRDALLNYLLDMEGQLKHSSQSAHPSSVADCIDLIGANLESSAPPLVVTFQSVSNNPHLSSIVRDTVASTKVPDANARKLVQNTFATLTKDGILSLFDQKRDIYLLVSIERVVRPYLCNLDRGVVAAPPFFIRSVPKMRMKQIADWIGNGLR